jgi:hypothetical protein
MITNIGMHRYFHDWVVVVYCDDGGYEDHEVKAMRRWLKENTSLSKDALKLSNLSMSIRFKDQTDALLFKIRFR